MIPLPKWISVTLATLCLTTFPSFRYILLTPPNMTTAPGVIAESTDLRIINNNNNIKSQADKKDPHCHRFQFAISGFAKCGTTTLGHWLYHHPDIISSAREVRGMHKYPPDSVARSIEKELAQRNPTTFAISGHHRMGRNERWAFKDLDPNKLIGSVCSRKPSYVCADTGAFHYYLAQLGKTGLDKEERRLLPNRMGFHDAGWQKPNLFPNPIFLLETSQLSDANTTRRDMLAADLQSYLGLQQPLSAIDIPHSNPGPRNKYLDICDTSNLWIRQHLLAIAVNASTWIQDYFLQSPGF